MDLAVFHYHLSGGGVTAVIAEACAILLQQGVVESITLITGSRENVEAVQERIGGATGQVRAAVHPQLRYAADIAGFDAEQTSREIKQILVGHYCRDNTVWWIHNHHIGKNPAFTRAVVEALAEAPRQRCILQIHDFPEAGRFANLAYLNEHVSVDPYPIRSNVQYAVINERDREVLTTAGIPPAAVSLLQNPVKNLSMKPAAPPRDVRAALADFHARSASSSTGRATFDPEGYLMVYPVRCIRRKNVLEAALVARLLEDAAGRHTNLIVTLPGVSEQERRYSHMVEEAYQRGLIRGVFGIGEALDGAGMGLADLMTQSDCIVSSSVQEGFGYAFFEGLASGTPLLARYLDVLKGTDALFEGFAAHFYHDLRVPFTTPSLSDTRAYLRSRYTEQIDELTERLPAHAVASLEQEVEEMLSGEDIDFSYLMPQMQYSYVADTADQDFRSALAARNAQLIANAASLIGARNDGAGAAVAERFGAEAFARAFRNALERLEGAADDRDRVRSTGGAATPQAPTTEPSDEVPVSRPIQNRVLRQFATPDYLRLLYSGI